MNFWKELGDTMAKISEKDVTVFMKVLKEVLSLYEKKPESLVKLLASTIETDTNKLTDSEKELVNDFDLFGMAKTSTLEEILEKLNSFSLNELKHIQKKYSFGGSQLRTAKAIAEHIADQAKKRSVDVFKNQA